MVLHPTKKGQFKKSQPTKTVNPMWKVFFSLFFFVERNCKLCVFAVCCCLFGICFVFSNVKIRYFKVIRRALGVLEITSLISPFEVWKYRQEMSSRNVVFVKTGGDA